MSARLATPAVAALVFAGCQTIDDLAPPVGEPALRQASMLDVPAANLERGRVIYVTKCTRCHRPEPVAGYSETQWRRTLPRMSAEANLTAQEAVDVRDYVMVTLQTLAPRGAAPDDP